MTNQRQVRPGDIFLTQGNSFVSRGIRFFSRSGGESRAEVNHVGIVVKGGWPVLAKIVEASSVVKRHSMVGYFNSKNTKVAVYRPINLTDETIHNIVARAESYVGMKYGYGKLVAHFLDWCIGGRYLFRRFALMDKYPICSWVVSHSYAKEDLDFGVHPGAASPDDIWVFVTTNPDKYTQIYPLDYMSKD